MVLSLNAGWSDASEGFKYAMSCEPFFEVSSIVIELLTVGALFPSSSSSSFEMSMMSFEVCGGAANGLNPLFCDDELGWLG